MDLKTQQHVFINLKQMVEVSQSRGCWKPTEMKDIGVTYNNLCKLLVEIEETINPPKVEEITKENNAQDIKNI